MGMAASAEDLMEATLFTAVAGDILLPTSFPYTLNELFIWLHQVLDAVHRISDLLVVAHGIFTCSLQTLSYSMWDLVP